MFPDSFWTATLKSGKWWFVSFIVMIQWGCNEVNKKKNRVNLNDEKKNTFEISLYIVEPKYIHQKIWFNT